MGQPIKLAWTASIVSTPQATLIDAGAKEVGFDKLCRWDIQCWDLEQVVQKGLRDYAEPLYAVARQAERIAVGE